MGLATGRMLTVNDLAQRWRVSPGTIRLWLKEGRLEGIKLPGGTWRFLPEHIAAVEANARMGEQ